VGVYLDGVNDREVSLAEVFLDGVSPGGISLGRVISGEGSFA
jgi:hypothetical protein